MTLQAIRCTLLIALACSLTAAAPVGAAQQSEGPVRGRVVNELGVGLAGVTITFRGTGLSVVSGPDGQYALENVGDGPHTLDLSFGSNVAQIDTTIDSTTRRDLQLGVDWVIFFAETSSATVATRQEERILAAPAAVSTMEGYEAEQQAIHGQVPLLTSQIPGVELPQSGLYDFNLNARGFNGLITRHMLTRVDGRDPSNPGLLGTQEWASVLFSLDDLERVELVRGPGSALYGAGAFNGVLDLRTRAPRDSLGGDVRGTVGELETRRFDARYAGRLADDWFFKVRGGHQSSHDFTRSRVGTVEYEGLPLEVVAPNPDVSVTDFSARVDRYFGSDGSVTFEAGWNQFENTTSITPAGRFQAGNVEHPWARAAFERRGWRLSGYYTGRSADGVVGLAVGGAGQEQSGSNLGIEVQWNGTFDDARGRIVAGGEFGRQFNIAGGNFVSDQRVLRGGVYGQLDYDLTTRLRIVGSARWDDSELQDPRVSPRIALVYEPIDGHAFRVSYAEAYQRPSNIEFALRSEVAPPIDLSALEQALAPALGGVPLHFESVPLLALGNQHLKVEKLDSLEIGYNGIFADQVFVNLAYYNNRIEDRTAIGLPPFGSPFGQLNPDYGPYQPPADLSPAAQAIVLASLQQSLPPELFGTMSNDLGTDLPMFAVATFFTFGAANTQGVELGVNYAFHPRWRLDFAYNWFDYEITEEFGDTGNPNAPGNQVKAAIGYFDPRFDGSLRLRWIDDFFSSAGVFQGPVPSYTVADLNFNYQMNRTLRLGVGVNNLFNNEHYEFFGGDLLTRRALVDFSVGWF